ncbi:saccharopine dehydrogenase family protein [Nannocystaceae bacterium ST9]
MPKTWILYGAYGDTGRLVSAQASSLGLQPILAGRDEDRLAMQAGELGLEYRVVELDDREGLDAVLADASLVLHCAGPFSGTSRPMVDACLRTRTHYLDISGEFMALQQVLERHAEARAAGILLLPGVGFDVVPTDCVARRLHEALPDADRLELGIGTGPTPTHGTAASLLQILAAGPIIRRNGHLVRMVEPSLRTIVLNRRPTACLSIAWGDVVTAYRSTGIPNIATWVQTIEYRGQPVTDFARFIEILEAGLAVGLPAPRPESPVRIGIWGRVVDPRGSKAEAMLDLPDGYVLTATAACEITRRILEEEVAFEPGATTPSLLLGSEFILDLPGVGGFGLRRELRA